MYVSLDDSRHRKCTAPIFSRHPLLWTCDGAASAPASKSAASQSTQSQGGAVGAAGHDEQLLQVLQAVCTAGAVRSTCGAATGCWRSRKACWRLAQIEAMCIGRALRPVSPVSCRSAVPWQHMHACVSHLPHAPPHTHVPHTPHLPHVPPPQGPLPAGSPTAIVTTTAKGVPAAPHALSDLLPMCLRSRLPL